MNAKPSFFTQEEKDILMDYNVSSVLAYTRINQLKWDRRRAITEPNSRKDRRKEALKPIETDVKTDTVYEIN
jgi:hypothetical protein